MQSYQSCTVTFCCKLFPWWYNKLTFCHETGSCCNSRTKEAISFEQHPITVQVFTCLQYQPLNSVPTAHQSCTFNHKKTENCGQNTESDKKPTICLNIGDTYATAASFKVNLVLIIPHSMITISSNPQNSLCFNQYSMWMFAFPVLIL